MNDAEYVWDHNPKIHGGWSADAFHAYDKATGQMACTDCVILPIATFTPEQVHEFVAQTGKTNVSVDDIRPYPPEAPLCPRCTERVGLNFLVRG